MRSKGVVRSPGEGGYGTTLHRDYDGEFDYNLQWKPVGGFPITFGWLHAIRRGQARLHRGLDVGVPNLILRSDHSVHESTDSASMQCGDAVLDVTQIARWAGCIGNRTTVVPVADAKHDVFLSLPEPREVAYRRTGSLAGRLPRARQQRCLGVGAERGDGLETYDVAIIGTGSGNSILDDRYRRQAGGDLRSRAPSAAPA